MKEKDWPFGGGGQDLKLVPRSGSVKARTEFATVPLVRRRNIPDRSLEGLRALGSSPVESSGRTGQSCPPGTPGRSNWAVDPVLPGLVLGRTGDGSCCAAGVASWGARPRFSAWALGRGFSAGGPDFAGIPPPDALLPPRRPDCGRNRDASATWPRPHARTRDEHRPGAGPPGSGPRKERASASGGGIPANLPLAAIGRLAAGASGPPGTGRTTGLALGPRAER